LKERGAGRRREIGSPTRMTNKYLEEENGLKQKRHSRLWLKNTDIDLVNKKC